MSRGVQPKNVSPLIKGARYSFLIFGYFYGVTRNAFLKDLERTEKPKRLAALHEDWKMAKHKDRMKTIDELKAVFKAEGFEPEPGWEDVI